MDFLNKYTVFLRKQYFTDLKSTLIKSGLLLLISLIVSCLVDFFLPFESFWIWGRTPLVVIVAFAVFTFGYLVSFFLYQSNRLKDDSYIPIKDRFSPTWRRRISIVVGAVLLAIIFTNQQNIVYTFVSGCIVASVITVIIFINMTPEEQDREFYGVPDVRDKVYNQRVRNAYQKKIDKKKKDKD